jgi:hypothetical protein
MGLADWRNLAIVWLAIQSLVMVIVVGVMFYFLNRGIVGLQEVVKEQSPRIHERLRQVASISQQASQKMAAPIIGAEAAGAKARRWVSALRSLSRN